MKNSDILQYQKTLGRLAPYVNAICVSLFNSTGINAFDYSRVFPDGSRSELWSNKAALECAFSQIDINKVNTYSFYSPKERYHLWEQKMPYYPPSVSIVQYKAMVDLRQYFDYAHCFFVVNEAEGISERFSFYTPSRQKVAYYTILPQLEIFIQEFKYHASTLIAQADQCKITPSSSGLNSESRIATSPLTPREQQVARWLLKSKRIKEIASILCIEPSTVQSHVNNMKEKCHTQRTTALIIELLKCKDLL